MGTSNKKTMSPLTADQQEKVFRRRRQGWSIEKIARDLHVSEKRVSAYLKSMEVQLESTSAKKPKEGKKIADKKAAKADKKPCKCGKCKKPAKTAKSDTKQSYLKEIFDDEMQGVIKAVASLFEDYLNECEKDIEVVFDMIDKGIPTERPLKIINEDKKSRFIDKCREFMINARPRVIIVQRMG